MRPCYTLSLFVFLLLSFTVNAQIIFNNPSFEGPAGVNITPTPWSTCGGTPDTGPIPFTLNGLNPTNGNTCMGLVNNIPGIEEKIGQQIPMAIDTLSCYQFDIDLKYLPSYLGGSSCNPGIFRVWLGNSSCDRDYLAWFSPRIWHTAYRTYTVNFTSPKVYTHVVLDIHDSLSGLTNVCMVFDNIHNESIDRVNINLGNDTTLCPGDSLLLIASAPGGSYIWQDNSTDSTFMVKSEGLYYVLATGPSGCRGIDSIYVAYENRLDLGNDTLLCGNDSIQILSNIQTTNTAYLWQDNSTSPNIIAADSGWYSLTTTSQFCVQNDSVLVEIISDPDIDLGNDTALCLGQNLLLDATTQGATGYLWSNNSTSSQLNVNGPGTYSVTVTLNTCDFADTIQIGFGSLAPFDLGPDTTLCAGDSILLSPPFNGTYSYMWSTNSTASSIYAKTPGIYWVDLILGNCIERDSILIDFTAFSVRNAIASRDTILCAGESLALDVTTTGAISYLWQDLSTNPQYLINQTGSYSVTITDGNCEIRDTIDVSYSNLLPFSLGDDTTLCPNEQLQLSAPIANNYSYLWQDASTNSTLNVVQAGLYWVEVNEGNCSERDSIQVNYNNFDPTELELGNDTTICQGDSLILDGTVSWGNSYLWSDNITTPQRTIKDPGEYILFVTNGNCTYSDTIDVFFFAFPNINLGPDTTLCLNDSLVLTYPNLPGVSYLWHDGSTTNEFIVRQDGLYWLQVTTANCVFRDTVVVDYLNIVAPRPRLGRDTNLCEGVQLVLDASHSNLSTYLWHDGSTTPTFIASGLKDSTYYVTVRNSVCVGRDTIVVGGIAKSSLENTTDTICANSTTELRLVPPDGSHLWQDGSTGDKYVVSDSGKYKVTTTIEHCDFVDSVSIGLIDCECISEVPSVFTPNGDGINDELVLDVNCSYSSFELSIYNRFGKLVFKSNHPNISWNGKDYEKNVNEGTYFYVISLKDEFLTERTEKGSITIIR